MDSQNSSQHELGGNHHLPLYSILRATMGLALKCHFVPDSQVEVSKFPKLKLSQLWRPITLCVGLWLRWSLKQSCNPCQKIANGMWHVTCTKEIRAIPDFLWLGIKLAIWLLAFLLVITYVLSAQMAHVNPFQTSTF